MNANDDPSGGAERRREPRITARFRVFYQHHGEAWLVEAETANLSSEGVFVHTHRPPLAVGTEVLISMRLGDSPPMMIKGQVAWTRASDEASRGMGLRFVELADEHAEAIQDFLQQAV